MSVAPPYSSRGSAAAHMASEFPEHSTTLRVATPTLEAMSEELLTKRAAYRALSLDIARLECDIKRKIGTFAGLKTRVGTWLWQKVQGKRRVDWLGLAEEHKLGPKAQAKHTVATQPTRILRFVRAKTVGDVLGNP